VATLLISVLNKDPGGDRMSGKAQQSFKDFKLEGELARRVQEVARNRNNLSLEERKRLCHYIADAGRDWKDVYHVVCDNIEFVVDKSITLREVWYRFMSVAPQEIQEFLEIKAQKLKKGWSSCYEQVVYYFLLALEAAGLSDMKEERPVEIIIAPIYGEMDLRSFEDHVRLFGKTVEDILKSYKFVIFVEKIHVARRIAHVINDLGGAVIAGKGFPTRYLRMLAKAGKLIILTDADKSGGDITNVIRYGSKRHRRIGGESFAKKYAVEGAIEVGLTRKDAERLGLTPIPETKRARKLGYEKRYELDALAALEAKGISDPYTAYVLAKLKLIGFDLKVYLPPDEEALKNVVATVLKRCLEPIIDDVVSSAARTIINEFKNIKVDDFTLRREAIEEAVRLAGRELKERIKSAAIEPEVWDIERRIKIVPSGVKTIKDYEEYLLHTTGAIKIMELLQNQSP